jgi:hypothetical protein
VVCSDDLHLSSFIPFLQYPSDWLAQSLAFVFLFKTGREELKLGFSTKSDTKAHKIKSLLVAFLMASALQLLPKILFDAHYHFGALWSFMLPAILFTTLDSKKPEETLAVWIADSCFALASSVIESITPDFLVVSLDHESMS